MRTKVLRAISISTAAALMIGCNGTVQESDGGGGAATTTTLTGSTTTSTGGATGTGSGAGGSKPDAPPGVVDICQDFDVDGAVFAIKKLYLGDTELDGTPSDTAWKHYGFNIDGQLSTADSKNLCQPAGDLPPKVVYPDGDAGFDNAFGQIIFSVFAASDPSASLEINNDIASGEYNVLLWLTALTQSADQPAFLSRAYGAPPQIQPPNFFGADCFTVEPRDVTNPMDVKSAKLTFPSSTLSANHWDSGVGARFVLKLKLQGQSILLPIHHVRFAMDLDSTHETAQKGRIGGVLDVEELIVALTTNFNTVDPSQCGGTLEDIISATVRRAADILKDGTQDPKKTCDGISIGLGFEAVRVKLGQPVLPGPTPDDPCAK